MSHRRSIIHRLRLVSLLRIYARKFPVTSAAAAIYFSAEGKGRAERSAEREEDNQSRTVMRGRSGDTRCVDLSRYRLLGDGTGIHCMYEIVFIRRAGIYCCLRLLIRAYVGCNVCSRIEMSCVLYNVFL